MRFACWHTAILLSAALLVSRGAEAQIQSAITRGPDTEKKIALVFTAHEYAEGADVILDQLARHKARASFFVTGDFLANTNFSAIVKRMVAEGHYVGPHSDKHLLYCSWEPPHATLVTRELFEKDLRDNLEKLRLAGIKRNDIKYFLPAYEHYNQDIARWTAGLGLTLVNYTPGTRSTADYTEEQDRNFVSSQTIYDSIIRRQETDSKGLNGFLLLLHLGAGPGRHDKFHERFGSLLDHLQGKGYQFLRIDALLNP